jgi:hypothetical protein
MGRRYGHKKGATASLTGYEMRNITLQSAEKRNLIHRKWKKCILDMSLVF